MSYVVHGAEARQSIPAAALKAVTVVLRQVRQLAVAFWHRRQVAGLLDLDDRMLKDIGITRFDVTAALSTPLHRDPTLDLAQFAAERRNARRAQARQRLVASPWEL